MAAIQERRDAAGTRERTRGRGRSRLGDLLREGRVRCVEVQQDRVTTAEYPVRADATETELAVVLARAIRAASAPGCVIRAELADLEGAHVANLVTTAP